MLVLLGVGRTDTRLIAKQRYLRAFAAEDYDRMNKVISGMG
ncbi:MAG: hypothetical protein OXU68_04780 [Bacteroidota bacterium]|nr:hypothetical protein [Bacteroidota bacterium]